MWLSLQPEDGGWWEEEWQRGEMGIDIQTAGGQCVLYPVNPTPPGQLRERDTAHDRVRGKYIGQGRVKNSKHHHPPLLLSEQINMCVPVCGDVIWYVYVYVCPC